MATYLEHARVVITIALASDLWCDQWNWRWEKFRVVWPLKDFLEAFSGIYTPWSIQYMANRPQKVG